MATREFFTPWNRAAHEVVAHIGSARGPGALCYCIPDAKPIVWPNAAIEILHRDTATVIQHLELNHGLQVGRAFERIRSAAATWAAKKALFDNFAESGADQSQAAAKALERESEEGLPEQRRLQLDLLLAEGACWHARFLFLATSPGTDDAFRVRRAMVAWGSWIWESFPKVVANWPLPRIEDVMTDCGPDIPATGGFYESPERWEFADIITPRYANPAADVVALANDEARQLNDLVIAHPLIKNLRTEIDTFIDQAVHAEQGHPLQSEGLLRELNSLSELIGGNSPRVATSSLPNVSHGPDFRHVNWFGSEFVFTPKQAACVRVLWDAWARGTPWVADGTLLQKAGVGDRQRLRDVFKNHAAWGKMIVRGPQQDLHGLKNS